MKLGGQILQSMIQPKSIKRDRRVSYKTKQGRDRLLEFVKDREDLIKDLL